jgi:uncharacterized membrane protein YhaH (DUF805 family)
VSYHQNFTALRAAALAFSILALAARRLHDRTVRGQAGRPTPALDAAQSPADVPLLVVIDDINPAPLPVRHL